MLIGKVKLVTRYMVDIGTLALVDARSCLM